MGTITIKKQSAASVALPATDQLRIFVDSTDDILKTKDSFGTVRPSGVGTADELSTTGSPVDVSASVPPLAGYVLVATTPTAAVWSPSSILTPTTVKTGPVTYTAVVGDLVRANVSGGVVTVNLPAIPASGSQLGVKLVSVATNNCVIVPNGANTIDGASSLILSTNYKWAILLSNGTSWMQIG